MTEYLVSGEGDQWRVYVYHHESGTLSILGYFKDANRAWEWASLQAEGRAAQEGKMKIYTIATSEAVDRVIKDESTWGLDPVYGPRSCWKVE